MNKLIFFIKDFLLFIYSKIISFKRIFFLYFVFSVLFVSLFYVFALSSPINFPKETIITIKDGMSLRSVSLYLKDINIIRSRVIFETFVIIYGGEKRLMSGDYLIKEKSPVFVIAKRISEGKKLIPAIKITIPEGFTNDEIGELLAKSIPSFNKNKFLENASQKEGYLFPDTYFLMNSFSEESIIDILNDNFNKKMSVVRDQILEQNKSEREILIMASILEKEANGDSDREIISGILWKRIKIGMPLQVDAHKETYKKRGLPEKPISNPGLEAIYASMYPKQSQYLYYLHDKKGNIHYASSFEEHKKNISLFLD